ncbi:MAG: hypothetical protein ACE5OW_07835 [Candidatus Bathyarchaeia archaeon]
MKLSTKITALSAILVADLSFFLFFKAHFPQAYDLIFQRMPWPDNVEKTFVIIIGFVTATVTSFLIAYMMLKRLLKSIKQG